MTTFALGSRTVHRVGFGAMQLPGPGVFGPPRDHDEAVRVLRRAVELGVDHIDTAQYYGLDVANELIREALHPYPENLALVSKVGGKRSETGEWLVVTDPAELRADIEANLRSLGVAVRDQAGVRAVVLIGAPEGGGQSGGALGHAAGQGGELLLQPGGQRRAMDQQQDRQRGRPPHG